MHLYKTGTCTAMPAKSGLPASEIALVFAFRWTSHAKGFNVGPLREKRERADLESEVRIGCSVVGASDRPLCSYPTSAIGQAADVRGSFGQVPLAVSAESVSDDRNARAAASTAAPKLTLSVRLQSCKAPVSAGTRLQVQRDW